MLIVSDDYTGAADAAVGFASQGFTCEIVVSHPTVSTNADVVALDLDTRHQTATAAAETVRAVIAESAGYELVFKKIDSTLRGQIAAELGPLATARATCPLPMLVAPAVPENSRTVLNGQVLVRGVPLEETDVWRREYPSPALAPPPRLGERLRQSGLPVEEIHLGALRQGVSALTRQLRDYKARGTQAVLLDSETSEDLTLIARAATSLESTPICVGAAGFARALGRFLEPASVRAPVLPPSPGKPVIFAIASQASTAREQVAHLSSRSDVKTIEVSDPIQERNERIDESVEEALRTGQHVLLCTPTALRGDLAREPAVALAKLVSRHAAHGGALVASGGDTARACLLALGYTRIEVAGELAPGVVLGYPSERPDLSFVSKAGDFGEAPTLSHCIDPLTLPLQGTKP